MYDDGRTIVGPAARLNISGNQVKLLYRRLESGGTNDWSGAGDVILVNGTFNNLPGAIFQARSEGDFRWNGGVNTFNNAGTFVKTGTNAIMFASVQFNNAGLVNLDEGTLSFSGGGTNSGTINLPAGTSLILGGNHSFLPGSALTGDGTVNFDQGTATVNGSVTAAQVQISSASVNFGADQTLKRLRISGGTLDGAGNITVTETLDWTAGVMIGAGRTVVGPVARFNLSGDAVLDAD
jgi:hypothetical protein